MFIEAPVYFTPLPSRTSACSSRLWVEAATVACHGLMWATVLAGPLLPADAATNTPAFEALKKACSTGSVIEVPPLIEKLITCTPSATAFSIAATLSPV